MTSASGTHPYCAVTVVLVPLDPDGKPQMERTVTLSGVAGPIVTDQEEVMIRWRPDDETGVRFTLTGSAVLI